MSYFSLPDRVRIWLSTAGSLGAQCLHGIDVGGARGRQPHGEQSSRGENHGGQDERRGIKRLDAEQEGGQKASESEGRRNSDDHAYQGELHTLPDDEPLDDESIGAERHADAHLLSTLRNPIGHQSVDADSAQKQSDRSKNGEQQHLEALPRRGMSHDLIHGTEMRHREAPAGDAQLLSDSWNERMRVTVRPHQPEERLDICVGRVIVIRHLGNGKDHHGLGIRSQTAVVEIGDDADYSFDSSLPPALSVVDVLANGVLVGKELPDEGLIDENNMRRVRVVVFGEVAPAQDGYSEQAQIPRRNTHPLAAAAIFSDRTSDDVEPSRAILYIDGAPKAGCSKFHAGQGIEPLAAISQELSDAGRKASAEMAAMVNPGFFTSIRCACFKSFRAFFILISDTCPIESA